MGTGWRRAFSNTAPKTRKEAATRNHFTPTMATTADFPDETDPKLHSGSPRIISTSNPSSPRSPFSIFRNTLRLSRSSCGVCMQSVKTGQGMAIYTAECSHAFHFPCIASHVRKQGSLVCPVCNLIWKDVPFLSVRNHNQEDEVVVASNSHTPAKNNPLSSPKYTKHGCLKSYADDEPLVSPVSKESQETEAPGFQEVEEFQGFFVNPISSSDNAFWSNRDSRNVEVCLLPEAAVICMGSTNETYAVVLKIKAPRPPPSFTAYPKALDTLRRAPIDLVTVLDMSESMGGAKLQMLKRTMHLVITSLGPADRLSVVVFSATPKRLMPLTRMTPQCQRSTQRIVDCLSCSHGSSIGEALKLATEVLQNRRERNPVASIILLSDGRDDVIPADDDTTRRHRSTHVSSTRFAHVELPINSYHHEPAEEAFSKRVGGLLSVVVHDLKIQLGFATGSDPAEILGVYSSNEHPTLLDCCSVKLGNLYAEEERELYIEIQVPNSNVSSRQCLLSVSCSHKDPATQAVVYGGDHVLLVPIPHDVRSGVPKVELLRYFFISTRAIAESRRLVEYDELCSAMQLLSSARDLLLQSRSELALELIKGLEAELAEVQWRQFQSHLLSVKKPVKTR